MDAKKSLGQHWLNDTAALRRIKELLEIKPGDTVLEIGAGKGALTRYLAESSASVVAVEYDGELAKRLANDVPKPLEVVNADFLEFDLESLPEGYKIVGNIPYYITGKIVKKCLCARNKPSLVVLLVQKEVAERIAAPVGKLSILGVLSQFYAEIALGPVATADKFSPAPKVDSQVVVLKPRPEVQIDKDFEKIVRAGFSAKRKKLKTALAGGLGIDKTAAEKLLQKSQIDPNNRAQNLSVADWRRLTQTVNFVI
ncbi:MAG: 16S rRNA (adenine(1518)-N(6)/adenine(1519)-N(6))-dimethyltransferase RsmA [Candidatus Nomurabacteria bacterium]|jgi:16S rRNA (adenine1518-N6/adenine1519-N6)-dimethyltransferase|nr:16S rRNA (adenine(1518)-N(6)/adenine(1519)-N(6))-dimethyltransferase RsmA [Candidatus Nomurabacteria bacterium]